MIDGIMTDEEFLSEIEYIQYYGMNRRGNETIKKANSGTAEQKYLWALVFYKRCLTFENFKDSEVYKYFKQAADAGHEKSALYLSILSDISISGDILKLYKEGNDIYETSKSTGKEHQATLENGALACWIKAVKKITELAGKGISPAQILLAEMYLNGKGVPRSPIHAYAWAEIARINGQPKAIKISNLAKSKISEKWDLEEIIQAKAKAADMLEANPELYEDLA